MAGISDNDNGGMVTKKSGYSFREAAVDVLQRHGNGEPMHCDDVTRIAMDEGLLVSRGRTPERTMNKTLNDHVGDIFSSDPKAVFYRDEWQKGHYGLYEWRKSGFPQARELNRRYVHGEIMKSISILDEVEFVAVAMKLIRRMGFRDYQEIGNAVRGARELGATLEVRHPTGLTQLLQYRVQVRKAKGAVTGSHMQQLSKSIKGRHVSHGLIIGRGNASNTLIGKANKLRKPIGIVAGKNLGHSLMLHGVGSEKTNERLFEYVGFEGVVGQADGSH